MKKSQLIILGILLAIAGYFYFSNQKSTFKKREADFSVKDTASITKIYLENKKSTVLLERKKNNWKLDQVHFANQNMVDFILKTIHDLRVKELVPDNQSDEIIKKLDKYSTMVEIYSYNKLIKTIYIGGSTKDKQGTYMMLDGSDNPYITEVPGFGRPLTHLFSTETSVWRSKTIFSYSPGDITNVSLSYTHSPEKSFTISVNKNELLLNGGLVSSEEQAIRVQQYLLGFQNVSFSQFMNNIPQNAFDSVISKMKFAELIITDRKGETQKIEAFYKPAGDKNDGAANSLGTDPDYFFIKNDSDDLLLAKYYDFDPVFRKLSDF